MEPKYLELNRLEIDKSFENCKAISHKLYHMFAVLRQQAGNENRLSTFERKVLRKIYRLIYNSDLHIFFLGGGN